MIAPIAADYGIGHQGRLRGKAVKSSRKPATYEHMAAILAATFGTLSGRGLVAENEMVIESEQHHHMASQIPMYVF